MNRFLLQTVVLLSSGVGTALALAPEEVLVVANNRAPESLELANVYASARGIPTKNILQVSTSTSYGVGRIEYDGQIAGPVREALAQPEGKGIKCIALMWGMPVHVLAPVPPPLTPQQQACRKTAERAHFRAAIAYKLLASVATSFPSPRTETFRPVVDLFTSPAPTPNPPLADFAELKDDICDLFDQKMRETAKIESPANGRIAWRQLMALQLELRGLEGLSELVEKDAPPTAPDSAHLAKLTEAARQQLGELLKKEQTTEVTEERLRMIDHLSGALGLYPEAADGAGPAELNKKKKTFRDRTISAQDASVDSELALVLWPDVRLQGWVGNPLYWRRRRSKSSDRPRLLMTARIDGPSAADAMRIIKASAQTESVGLKGNFYIDAGGGPSLAFNDNFGKLHGLVKRQTGLNSVLDTATTVFQTGSCPKAALYVGWYSLRKYVPAFSWSPGAVGWHHASYEAIGLRDPAAQTWCPKMIQNGVAATLGAVAEPLLGALPLPQDFFALLMTGKYTLAECYWRTIPSASWRLTLVGDPLYTPFAVNPQLDVRKLPPQMLR